MNPPGASRWALQALAAAAAAVLLPGLLAGCASIPTSGPVRPGQDVSYDVDDSLVRVLAPPPRTGAAPEDIVRGFLLTSASFEGDHSQARLFLAPGVRDTWRPDTGVRIYDSATFRIDTVGDQVQVTVRQSATIDGEGRYLRLPEPLGTTVTFAMEQVDGEWRVAALEDGLLLTTFDVRRAYRDVQVFFLDPDRRIAVPDLLMLPARPNLATALTNRLLRGPTSWLAPAVDTAFPVGTALNVASVPVVNGVAEVDLNEAALTASPADRQAMAAQLTWTLRQLPQVRSLRMTVNDREFAVPGVSSLQSRDSWPNFDPTGLPAGATAYVVRGGRLGVLDGEDFRPVAGPAGDGRRPLVDPAVSLPGDAVAGLSGDRGTLYRGLLAADEELAETLLGGDLGPPSWDHAGNVWSVDRGTDPAAVRVVAPDGTVAPVQLDDTGPGNVAAVQVARDGTRAVVLVSRPDGRHDVLVGTVLRGEGGRVPARISGLVQIAGGLDEVRDVAWLDAATVVLLARRAEGSFGPLVVDANGYSTASPNDSIDAVSIAAAPGPRPTLVATESGELLSTSSRSWEAVGAGAFPTYPG